MENHPIPQDVTGFKFKLIGSVTVKQFLYLLGFGILTTVVFVLDVNIFLKIPLMMLFALIGAALAFVPIEGRPMDTMIVNFAKAIPSENRYIYRKRGANLTNYEFLKISVQAPQKNEHKEESPQNEKRKILLNRLNKSSFKPDAKEAAFFKNLKSIFEEGAAGVQKLPDQMPDSAPPVTTPHFIRDADEQKFTKIEIPTESPALPGKSKAEDIQKELEEARKMQEENPEKQEDLGQRIKELERQLQESLQEKDNLARKVIQYQTSGAKKKEQIFVPSIQEQKQETQNVRFVDPGNTLRAGFPTLPDVPNIVMGIVKDPRGKTLPNILVEFLDSNNLPVRAFKTNALGQFASATPLANGTYKVYFEDPQKQHEFQIIEITLSGEIFNPLEIISIDAREKLRQELFGNQTLNA